MADTLTYAYAADIVKVDRDENGDLLVYGKASGPDLDGDEQVCDPVWLKSAMPGWAEWSNIREMHQPICAGVGLVTEEQGDDWWVRSKVLDPTTAKKIEHKGLRGYSVGIKNPRVVKDATAPGGRIVGGDIVEISYVDRPCNPSAKLAICKAVGVNNTLIPVEAPVEQETPKFTPADMAKIVNKNSSAPSNYTITTPGFTFTTNSDAAASPVIEKRDFNTAQRDQAADSGAAMKDGSFPIKSVSDLRNAIRAVGRAKNPAAAKAHIKRRAAALGKTDLIPDGWKAVEADVAKAEHDPAEIAAVRDGLIALIKAELDELADGDPELCDIGELLTALKMLMWWWEGEAAGGETTSPYDSDNQEASVMLAAESDQTKAVDADAATTGPVDTDQTETDETKVEQPDGTKAATPETSEKSDDDRLTELVKSAVADATKTLTEQAAEREKALATKLDAVEADLAKVLALPEAGGPVITRTAAQAAVARDTDRELLLTKAQALLTKADQVQPMDQYLAAGYRERAAELRERASA